MRPFHLLLAALSLALLLASAPASAETVVEAWRSPIGSSNAITVAPDGTAWAASGASVLHLAVDGSLLGQTNGFRWPIAISAAPDGGCWTCDIDAHAVVRLGADGHEVWRQEGFSRPWAVSVNPADGTGWVADVDAGVVRLNADGASIASSPVYFPKSVSVNPSDGGCWVAGGGSPLYAYVTRLGPDGGQLATGSGFSDPMSVALDPLTGRAWVIDASDLVLLDADGNEEGRQDGPWTQASVSIDTSNGSCWIAEASASADAPRILHVALAGTVPEVLLDDTDIPYAPGVIAPNPSDQSCWISASGGIQFSHMAENGAELWTGTGICYWPSSISNDTADGSAWATSPLWNSVTHVGADGATRWQGWGFNDPTSVSANSADGTCWVADTYNARAVHLAGDGSELSHRDLGDQPSSVSVNPSDGSCWVASSMYSHVAHLPSIGDVIWQSDAFSNPRSVSVNWTDGSCWVADYNSGQVVHLAANGSQLFRGGAFQWPHYVSVNPADGSVWVSDIEANTVAHLDRDGVELWRSPEFFIDWPGELSVNPVDGSCWVPSMTSSQVVHLSARGHEKWRGTVFSHPESVSVNQADGSCWVADTRNNQLVRLAVVPDFEDAGYGFWAADYIEACVEAGIVAGYGDGTYRPDYQVTREQMAVFIARAVAGGDAAVPTGPAEATFTDVPIGQWAFRYIEYCYAANIVAGYSDGYHPTEIVDRAQMAVFVARSIVDPTGEEGLAGYVPPTTATFPDVPTDFWAYKHIEYCVAQGVTSGYWDGYHPEREVTRDQMAVYVARSFHLPM